MEKKSNSIGHNCLWKLNSNTNNKYSDIESYIKLCISNPLSRNQNGETLLEYFNHKTVLDVWSSHEQYCLLQSVKFYQTKWNWWGFIMYLKCCWFNYRSAMDIKFALQNMCRTDDMEKIAKPLKNCILLELKDMLQINDYVPRLFDVNRYWDDANPQVLFYF